MTKTDIVIVGAGLTGIMAAKDQGYEVLLMDKGKSVGDRMATRRLDSGKVDHGAQFLLYEPNDFSRKLINS
jgi:hypothetical protein